MALEGCKESTDQHSASWSPNNTPDKSGIRLWRSLKQDEVIKTLPMLWTCHGALFNPSSTNGKSMSQVQIYQNTVVYLSLQGERGKDQSETQPKKAHGNSGAAAESQLWKRAMRSPGCSWPEATGGGTQQTCGRRCSGQIRPKLNFLAWMQDAVCGGKPTPHLINMVGAAPCCRGGFPPAGAG